MPWAATEHAWRRWAFLHMFHDYYLFCRRRMRWSVECHFLRETRLLKCSMAKARLTADWISWLSGWDITTTKLSFWWAGAFGWLEPIGLIVVGCRLSGDGWWTMTVRDWWQLLLASDHKIILWRSHFFVISHKKNNVITRWSQKYFVIAHKKNVITEFNT